MISHCNFLENIAQENYNPIIAMIHIPLLFQACNFVCLPNSEELLEYIKETNLTFRAVIR